MTASALHAEYPPLPASAVALCNSQKSQCIAIDNKRVFYYWNLEQKDWVKTFHEEFEIWYDSVACNDQMQCVAVGTQYWNKMTFPAVIYSDDGKRWEYGERFPLHESNCGIWNPGGRWLDSVTYHPEGTPPYFQAKGRCTMLFELYGLEGTSYDRGRSWTDIIIYELIVTT